MDKAEVTEIESRPFPARRASQNLVGGPSPIQAKNFGMGSVVLEGTGEMCLGDERRTLNAGQDVLIPSGVFHQLTHLGNTPLHMIYCYGPAGDVAHLVGRSSAKLEQLAGRTVNSSD